jgi:ribosome-associated translation inhibitor RaiA
MVEEHILALGTLLIIEEAKVRLECSFQESPPFRVVVKLVTPGPDLEVEERDHTMPAALLKAMACLEKVIAERGVRRKRRVLSNLSEPLARRHRAR